MNLREKKIWQTFIFENIGVFYFNCGCIVERRYGNTNMDVRESGFSWTEVFVLRNGDCILLEPASNT